VVRTLGQFVSLIWTDQTADACIRRSITRQNHSDSPRENATTQRGSDSTNSRAGGGIADKFVTIDITFECLRGHPIELGFLHLQEPGGHRLIEEQLFDLTCPVCGWTGSKRGSEAKAIKAR